MYHNSCILVGIIQLILRVRIQERYLTAVAAPLFQFWFSVHNANIMQMVYVTVSYMLTIIRYLH